jgi:protein required for attachment to host cells
MAQGARMKKIYYILVADSGAAKLFRAEGGLNALELVQEQANPEGRKTRSELESDRPGQQRNDSGGMHGLGGDSDAQQHERAKFARSLCTLLQSEQQAGKFTNLLIAAPPHFLGDLRQHLSKDCLRVLGKSVNKNLLRVGEKDVIAHFSGYTNG